MYKLTPIEIQQQRFSTRFRGFDIREVDLFLEEAANAFENIISENESQRKEIRELKLEAQEFRNREESFKRIMLNSQKVIEQMKDNATKNGEIIIAKAEVGADKILNGAHIKLARLNEEITELKYRKGIMLRYFNEVIIPHENINQIVKDRYLKNPKSEINKDL